MRPIEKLLLFLMLPTTVWLLHPQWPGWMSLFALATPILFLIHAAFEGVRWQMFPAYAAMILLAIGEYAVHGNDLLRITLAVLVCLSVAGSLTLSWALPMFEVPAPTGKFPVGTQTMHLSDLSRAEMHEQALPGHREVIVQLWYPAATRRWPKAKYRKRKTLSFRSSYQSLLMTHALQAPPVAAGSFPLIIHNPAWHDNCARSTFLLQELASHGFVVAGISHPYNSTAVELGSGTVVSPDRTLDLGFSKHHFISFEDRVALAEEELAIQTRDCVFVLDELQRLNQSLGHPLSGRLQMNRVGAHGFSFGGAVSMELAYGDDRVCSALLLDGVVHGAAAKHGVYKPFMLIDTPWIVKPGDSEENANRRDVDNAKMWKDIAETKERILSQHGGMRVIVQGIGHADFTDQIFMSPIRRLTHGGDVAPRRVANILNSYTLAFFRKTLYLENGGALDGLIRQFPETSLQTWAPGVIKDSDANLSTAN